MGFVCGGKVLLIEANHEVAKQKSNFKTFKGEM